MQDCDGSPGPSMKNCVEATSIPCIQSTCSGNVQTASVCLLARYRSSQSFTALQFWCLTMHHVLLQVGHYLWLWEACRLGLGSAIIWQIYPELFNASRCKTPCHRAQQLGSRLQVWLRVFCLRRYMSPVVCDTARKIADLIGTFLQRSSSLVTGGTGRWQAQTSFHTWDHSRCEDLLQTSRRFTHSMRTGMALRQGAGPQPISDTRATVVLHQCILYSSLPAGEQVLVAAVA